MTTENKRALLIVSSAMVLIDSPASACGVSLGPGGLAFLLAVAAAAIAVPICLSSAGLIAAARMRRSGRFTFGKMFLSGFAGLSELCLAKACGFDSLVGLACIGAVAIKMLLVAGAPLADPRSEEPLRGVLTIRADERIFANAPR